MSRFIDAGQYDTLTNLRGRVAKAIADNSPEDTHRTIGMVQGFLIGLHAAGEIDAMDVKTLEQETLANVHFILNARKAAGHAN
jgi:hypothetical protein